MTAIDALGGRSGGITHALGKGDAKRTLGRKFRLQKVVFETARDIYDQMKPGWKGNKECLLA